ncbi:MAG: tetratricopeptide repeat protein [Candidatus Eisenbacteria bacterium]|uniref:Tetratricopeptide repeat protein n=1 Tax=Eiseniibacteriota bacterium TaxID=2212470 RepID=A0A538UDP5_UNCEI|nr:MAG: tetratricopeptide repeat protein [Candidatus Eisenbacteria bacterium]
MAGPEQIRDDFVRVVQHPDAALDLARAALLVAAEADPRVDIDGQLHTLDTWAAELRRRLAPDWNNLQKLARLRSFVFEELGFQGDAKDYFSPSNSLLHEVIQRRRGVPLTLSIIFMELGWRIGIPFEGVGFPGHFLIRLTGEPRDLVLDPFNHARTMHEEDCRRLLDEVTGGRLEFDDRLLASVSKRDMITRLLRNLKGAYLRADDDEGALAAVERLLLLSPDDHDEVRDRGLLLFRLRRHGAALDALTAYLKARPEAPDRDAVAQQVVALRQLLADLN